MVSRWFGGSSKKQPKSDVNPPLTPSENQDEDGFTHISGSQQSSANNRSSFPGYPSLSPGADGFPPHPPEKPRSESSTNVAGSYSVNTASGHALDGVRFVLAGACSATSTSSTTGTSASSDVEKLVESVETRLRKLESLTYNADYYDFNLEKSVMQEDITATMRRMQAT